jgi:hypothetical protein
MFRLTVDLDDAVDAQHGNNLHPTGMGRIGVHLVSLACICKSNGAALGSGKTLLNAVHEMKPATFRNNQMPQEVCGFTMNGK